MVISQKPPFSKLNNDATVSRNRYASPRSGTHSHHRCRWLSLLAIWPIRRHWCAVRWRFPSEALSRRLGLYAQSSMERRDGRRRYMLTIRPTRCLILYAPVAWKRRRAPSSCPGHPALAFNGTTRTGGTSKGLVWKLIPPADVVSPGGGHVVHAADFRGCGNLVVIRSGGDFHLLIAGLSTLAAKHGDAVQPGTLLGTVTAKAAKNTGSEANSARIAMPAIYFELRKDGEPIDPLPWMPLP